MAGKRRTNDFCYFWGVNYLLIILGAVSLGLGVAGMFLPVLPTTPFLLLTAWCWMKGSPRLHVWLMAHPKLGPYIRDFQEHKCISRRVKAVSVTTLWLTIALSIILVRPLWLRIKKPVPDEETGPSNQILNTRMKNYLCASTNSWASETPSSVQRTSYL